MSEVVKCLALTKKASRCSFNAKTGGLCGCHAPKTPTVDQKPQAVKKPKKVLTRQLIEENNIFLLENNILSRENNILLRALAKKEGINVEELLGENPTLKSYF